MGWNAKPVGYYVIGSPEYVQNTNEMNALCNEKGYTLEAQAGLLGNVYGESGLNPWRWGNDSFNLNTGYGLFMITPATVYINGCQDIPGYAPNLSTTGHTPGAKPTDAIAQFTAFDTGRIGWLPGCWRSYWDPDTYPSLYRYRREVLDTYGSGSSISMAQWKLIDDIRAATFVFLACFEGPAIPNLDPRVKFANSAYYYLTGDTPAPQPPLPPGGGGRVGKLPLWYYLRVF